MNDASTSHTQTLQYRACELSISGHDNATVADSLGITPERAQELICAELDRRTAEFDPKAMRQIEMERLSLMLEALKEKAEAGNKQAISLTLNILARQDRLRALAPYK